MTRDFEDNQPRILREVVIPNLPEVVLRLQALLGLAEPSVNAVSAAIGHAPGIAGRVLKIANGAFYGLREPALSIPQAVLVLGLGPLRDMVLQVSLIEPTALQRALRQEPAATQRRDDAGSG